MKMGYEILLMREMGKIFKELRTLKGMTQAEVARGLIDQTAISAIELGKINGVKAVILNGMAKKLDASLEDIIKKAKNNINDLSQKKREKIINLINFGKYDDAEKELVGLVKNVDKNEYRKYVLYVKGSGEYYKENYSQALKHFVTALGPLDNSDSFNVLSFIDVFLATSYLSTLANMKSDSFHDTDTIELIYRLKNSIEFYMFLDSRLMLRMMIYSFAQFRLLGYYEVCDLMAVTIEDTIEEFVYYENDIDYKIEKILYYLQRVMIIEVDETIKKTQQFLQSRDLKQLEEYFNKRLRALPIPVGNFKK